MDNGYENNEDDDEMVDWGLGNEEGYEDNYTA